MKAVIVQMDPTVLRFLLQLPDGVYIDRVDQPVDRPGVLLLRIVGMGMDLQEGFRIPEVVPIVHTASLDDGTRVVSRVDWRCPQGDVAP